MSEHRTDLVRDVSEAEAPVVATTRPWSAAVVGMPGDNTLLVVDWLVLACASVGLVAQAMPLGDGPDAPHGMYVELLPPGCESELMSDVPWQAVDLLVAGEHLELVRALRAGFAHPDVTTVVASCRREFTQAEQVMAPHAVLVEHEIDELATASAKRYVAFDAPEVAGWYRMPGGIQPSLLLGAVFGSGAVGLDQRSMRAAIRRLGIDVSAHTRGFKLGLRMGRRSGGRVHRTLTAAQFVRTRRAGLDRRERAGFELLVERVEHEFAAAHRPVLRAAVHTLVDYHSTAYAAQLVDYCAALARDEDAAFARAQLRVDPVSSVVPVVARHLTTMLAYIDLAHVAHVKLRRQRLPELRRRHGVSRRDRYEVRELLPIDAYERAQLAPQSLAARIDPSGSPLLCEMRRATIVTTSLAGALRLRHLRHLRSRRERSARHLLELEAAETYVRSVREALAIDADIARLIADSGSLIHGFGPARAATRASAMAFWGRVVCQVIAIDRSARDEQWQLTRLVIPFVIDQVGRNGHLALWEYAGRVLAIALHHARTGDHAEALTFARALCAA